jgi:ketosteroid isomerase-like protein
MTVDIVQVWLTKERGPQEEDAQSIDMVFWLDGNKMKSGQKTKNSYFWQCSMRRH